MIDLISALSDFSCSCGLREQGCALPGPEEGGRRAQPGRVCTPHPQLALALFPVPPQQDLPRSPSQAATFISVPGPLHPSLPRASLSIRTARSHMFVKKPAALQRHRVLLSEAGSPGLGCVRSVPAAGGEAAALERIPLAISWVSTARCDG